MIRARGIGQGVVSVVGVPHQHPTNPMGNVTRYRMLTRAVGDAAAPRGGARLPWQPSAGWGFSIKGGAGEGQVGPGVGPSSGFGSSGPGSGKLSPGGTSLADMVKGLRVSVDVTRLGVSAGIVHSPLGVLSSFSIRAVGPAQVDTPPSPDVTAQIGVHNPNVLGPDQLQPDQLQPDHVQTLGDAGTIEGGGLDTGGVDIGDHDFGEHSGPRGGPEY
jgi:hypothetical protein